MGRLARALVLATTVATVVALLVPVSRAAAKTTVKSKGGVVTIVIRVDVYGGEGQTGPTGQPLDEYWEQIVNEQWGQAFDRLPYKNCYKFKLDLDIQLRSRDADDRKGRHRIHVKAPRTGNDWTDVGWDNVPETSRDPRTGDGQRSFENDQVGEIPVNAPPTVVAHEFGHVFGLGDDRKNGVAKPGRDGTLMVGGARGVDANQPLRIDQNLIDRIGKLIDKHLQNQGKKLPDCESWTGTLRTDVDPCRETGYPVVSEGPVQVAVAPDGSATGGGTITLVEVGAPLGTEAACYTAVAPGSYSLPVELSGTREGRRLHLTVFGAPMDVKVRGKTAQGTTNLGGTTATINLTCAEGCDERVG